MNTISIVLIIGTVAMLAYDAKLDHRLDKIEAEQKRKKSEQLLVDDGPNTIRGSLSNLPDTLTYLVRDKDRHFVEMDTLK